MIVSLLFYVIYPLSRYLNRRLSESSEKSLPPAVNGSAVWDGGGFPVVSIQSQTTMLDQRRDTKMDTKERVNEPGPKTENDTSSDTDKEPLMDVLHEDTKVEMASKMNKAQLTSPGEVEAPEQENGEMLSPTEVMVKKQDVEDGSTSPSDHISPEQALVTELKHLEMEDSLQDTTCTVLEQIQKPTLGDPVTSLDDNVPETARPAQSQILMHTLEEAVTPAVDTNTFPSGEQLQTSNKEGSQMPTETTSTVTECWDEYMIPTGNPFSDVVGNSELVFSPLLSGAQTPIKLCPQQHEETTWHFPAGPGLAEEESCQLWSGPVASYYPPMEQTFDIIWRLWEDTDESTDTSEPALIPFEAKASMDFSVMSYNILAQDLLELNQQLYVHCPLEVLDWDYRCALLLAEMEKWAPDILCLQEVHENHYYEQLHPALSQMGYTCVYKRRTGTKMDGCATCYRSSRFSEVTVTKLEFFRPETELLDRHNVGIVLLLRPLVGQGAAAKEHGPPLCVANTHLLFNPRRGDVKLAQLGIMLAEIDATVKSCKAKGEHCNVVFCGDFNSLPNMPLYQLITTGELYFQGLPAWMISGQEDLSYKPSCHKLFAPLWPGSLGITDNCQYASVNDIFDSQSQKSEKCRYSHDFMKRLRCCPAALVRPEGLELIHGVTDKTPDALKENQHYDQRFRHSIRHRLDLESVQKHAFQDSVSQDITTLHSEGGAAVDYIFYSPKRILTPKQKSRENSASEGLKLVGSLSLLSEDVLWSMGGLPNHVFPSDHLSVVARFQLDLNTS
ncbi:protein angel homolog 1 [Cololabis saira]|uniref:protein angel homolog 1 n=1 Tax=Cololabis saira TaxID=129043 RepID=UPI002AD4C371|nr:protein angel homolog 1 [Cololabis saira]